MRENSKETADLSAACPTAGGTGPLGYPGPNEQTKSVVPHLRRPAACPMDPALPGWTDFWCRPTGPGLSWARRDPLFHCVLPGLATRVNTTSLGRSISATPFLTATVPTF